MKKAFLILLSLTTAILFTSCNLEDEINEALGNLLEFNLELNESFTVPGTNTDVPNGTELPTPQPFNIEIGPFENQVSSFLNGNTISTQSIESITASLLSLRTNGNFNAIESIRISAGEVVIGSNDNIPADAQEIELTPNTNEDLKDILNQDEVTFDVELLVKEVIADGLEIDFESDFLVKGRVNL